MFEIQNIEHIRVYRHLNTEIQLNIYTSSKYISSDLLIAVCDQMELCAVIRGTVPRYCCLLVDHVITCTDDYSERSDHKRMSVVFDRFEDRILSVQEGVPVQQLEDTELVDCPPGTTLMPGFIDCHVHLTIATDDYQLDHLRLSSADKSLRALRAAQGLLRAGFTTVRSAGDADTYFPSFAVAKSIARKEFVGPRIVGAGHYISVTGGGGDINFLSKDNCPCCPADGVVADGKEEMIKAVRNEIKYGSDWIKLLVCSALVYNPLISPSIELTFLLFSGDWCIYVRQHKRSGLAGKHPFLVGGNAGVC